MPQHVQPDSLRVMAVEQVAKMAFHAFVAIEAKHELFKWSAALQKEVTDLQEFFLSNIQHLWDDVCQVICDMYVLKNSKDRKKQFKLYKCPHDLRDIRVLALFMIHDQMKKLALSVEVCSEFRDKLSLSECQIGKLKSIEKLDILDNDDIKITDKLLKMIGCICKDLKVIHISLHSSDVTLETLNNLLKCKELQDVIISTDSAKKQYYEPFMIKLLTDLPKLKRAVVDMNILPKLTSFTSIEHLTVHVDNANELKEMIKFCPNIHHLCLNINSKTREERQEVQTFLAECTLQLLTLEIIRFTFDQSMGHLLQLKGGNLTRLELEEVEGADITLDNIHVIGINCPKLEVLHISESIFGNGKYKDASFRSPVLPPETLIVTTPPMFCCLEELEVSPKKGWDIRLLLQILLHANNLKRIQITDLRFHGSCDILAEILSVNPLIKLEQVIFDMLLSTGVFSRISRSSLMQLIDSCPKLNHLELDLTLEHDAFRYMKELETKVHKENLDLELDFSNPPGYVDSDFEDIDDFEDMDDFEDTDDFEDSEGMDDLEVAEGMGE